MHFFQAQHYYLIQDLITWKDYVLQVASYNNKGVGVYSDGIRIKTKEGGKFLNYCCCLRIYHFYNYIIKLLIAIAACFYQIVEYNNLYTL